MLFAAGLGVRLRPLTDDRPKALVSVAGKTLLERNLAKLSEAGITQCVVNAHHFAPLIKETLSRLHFGKMEIYLSDESEELLDTGGGLLKAAALLSGTEPVLIHNVDILSDFSLAEFEKGLITKKLDVMLAVSDRKGMRKLYFDADQHLCGWVNHDTGNQQLLDGFRPEFSEHAFSGISIIKPELLKDIPFAGKFGLISLFLYWTKKYNVSFYDHTGHIWFDVGSQEKLAEAEKIFSR